MNKPVFLLGAGLCTNPALIEYLCSLGVPVLTTWQGIDLVAEDCPVFCGRPGVFGQRAANIIQQKADRLYCFGARLDGEQIAYDYDRFAPRASKFIWDCDLGELAKFPPEWVRSPVDLQFMTPDDVPPIQVDPEWLVWCKALYRRFRPELDGCQKEGQYIDTFAFMSALSDAAQPDDLLAIGSSSGAVNAFLQSFKVKAGQRVTVCASIGAMGADIPMAIGGCLASGRRTIVVTGDGGWMLNIQELEVIHRLNLPITIFVFNNGGYNSIRTMQDARFNGRRVGAGPDSGFTVPDIGWQATAYKIDDFRLSKLEWLSSALEVQPRIVEVKVDPEWRQLPRVMASTINGQLRADDMERMTPLLPDDELKAIMEWGNA